MREDGRTELTAALLALTPEQFAREADQFLGGLSDGERGLLASALIDTHAERKGESESLIAELRLDSADPSLMSRGDVATLLTHLQTHDKATLRHALRTLHDEPQMHTILGSLFAPSRGSSDTSTLGSDPTINAAAHDQSSPR